ncbi:right-handed parallel beta-helix repeat-containing protein [Candidatus Pacearchaeota archaeon]|nr:right-handed parallel beta-helix repeat-containing protein [Candidatus Pacearchaeota archaeon]
MALDLGSSNESIFGHNNTFDEGINKRGIRAGGATIVLALDGSGDAESVKEAINMLPSAGGLIFVKEGIYDFSVQITLNKSNVSFVGVGRASVFDINVGTGIKINSADYVTFANIRFTCDEERTYPLWFLNSTGSSVKDCWIDGEFAIGIFMNGTNSNMIITGNFISSTLEAGISTAGVTELIISNNSVDNGLFISGSSRVVIDSNIVRNQTDGTDGISISGDSNNCIISNNYVEDDSTGDRGIAIFSSDNNIITGNRVRDFANGVEIVDGNCDRNLVGHNILIDNTNKIVDGGTNTLSSNNIVA